MSRLHSTASALARSNPITGALPSVGELSSRDVYSPSRTVSPVSTTRRAVSMEPGGSHSYSYTSSSSSATPKVVSMNWN